MVMVILRSVVREREKTGVIRFGIEQGAVAALLNKFGVSGNFPLTIVNVQVEKGYVLLGLLHGRSPGLVSEIA
jgi:hypothetical protein